MASLRLRRDKGAEIELDRDRSLIGRDTACEIVVDDKSVSRRHALIERRGEDWLLTDQGSANGTYLDGRRVSQTLLQSGQQLRLGSVTFQVEATAPATVLMSAPDLSTATLMIGDPMPAAPPPPPVAPRPVAASSPPPRSEPPPVVSPPAPAAPSAGDPLSAFGLGPGASAEEVRARYEELSQDLQTKLAGARSAALKSTYEKNLVALHRAFRQASRGLEPIGDVADLPSAQPVVAADNIDASGVLKRPAEEEIPLGEAAAAKGSAALLPGVTSLLVFLATGLLALIAFFALSSGKIEKAIKKQEEAPELVGARQLAARLAPAVPLLKGGALRNGRLRLCNRSARSLEIDWLSAVYIQKTDLPPGADSELAKLASGFKLATYNSGFCGQDFHVVLAPGSEQAVELQSQEARCNFDGGAVFYALSLRRPAEGPPEPAEAVVPPGRRSAAAPEAPEKQPGDPGTTFWQSGLLGGRDDCIPVGIGW